MHHFSDIDRLAVVGEKKCQEGMATFCKPFTKATVPGSNAGHRRNTVTGTTTLTQRASRIAGMAIAVSEMRTAMI